MTRHPVILGGGPVRSACRWDRGSATVWMIALMAVVWVVAIVAMSAGAVRAARHRAHAAADLAALAAAAHFVDGPGRACGVAAAIARATRARLIRCALRDRISEVQVEVAAHVLGLGSVELTAIARAGPVVRPAAVEPPAARTPAAISRVASRIWVRS